MLVSPLKKISLACLPVVLLGVKFNKKQSTTIVHLMNPNKIDKAVGSTAIILFVFALLLGGLMTIQFFESRRETAEAVEFGIRTAKERVLGRMVQHLEIEMQNASLPDCPYTSLCNVQDRHTPRYIRDKIDRGYYKDAYKDLEYALERVIIAQIVLQREADLQTTKQGTSMPVISIGLLDEHRREAEEWGRFRSIIEPYSMAWSLIPKASTLDELDTIMLALPEPEHIDDLIVGSD